MNLKPPHPLSLLVLSCPIPSYSLFCSVPFCHVLFCSALLLSCSVMLCLFYLLFQFYSSPLFPFLFSTLFPWLVFHMLDRSSQVSLARKRSLFGSFGHLDTECNRNRTPSGVLAAFSRNSRSPTVHIYHTAYFGLMFWNFSSTFILLPYALLRPYLFSYFRRNVLSVRIDHFCTLRLNFQYQHHEDRWRSNSWHFPTSSRKR